MLCRFVQEQEDTVASAVEHANQDPGDMVTPTAELRLSGLLIPEGDRGAGLGPASYAVAVEALARHWMGLAGSSMFL
jgi:alkylation response protein AidB-like acyl-CoA dehydrogenase